MVIVPVPIYNLDPGIFILHPEHTSLNEEQAYNKYSGVYIDEVQIIQITMQDSRNVHIGSTILNVELPTSSSVSSSKHAMNNGIRNRTAIVRSNNGNNSSNNDIENEYNHTDDDDIFVVCQPQSNRTSSGTGTQSDGTVPLADLDNTKDHHHHHQYEDAQYLDQNMDLQKYPVKELKIYIYGLQDPIVFNPFVTFIGVTLLWGVVIWTLGT
jgi:hypothetical protein